MKRWMVRGVLLLLFITATLAVPRFAIACGGFDYVGCEADSAQYGLYETATVIVWEINRIALTSAYAIDGIRWNVINVAFAGAYTAVESVIGPFIVPVAGLALTVALLAIIALPAFGGNRTPFNIRNILTWMVLAPILLTLIGPWFITVEQTREQLGNQIFQAASSASFSQATLGASGDGIGRMGDVQPLYDNGRIVCGQVLPRYSGGDYAAGDRRLDELVASYLLANVQDIHCPNQNGGPSVRLPSGYYNTQVSPPYAIDGGIREMSASERSAQIGYIQLGLQRQLIGIIPSALAVLYAVLNLVFSLAMVALWTAFPLGILIGFFQSDSGWVGGYVRKAVTVLQASWVASFIIGLIFAAIRAAADTNSTAIFAGVSLGSGFFTVFTLGTAVGTFKTALGAIGGMVSAASGASGVAGKDPLALAGGAITGAGKLAATAATGGAAGAAGAALTAATALKQSGSGTYAMAATLGRFSPIAGTAEAAAGLGMVSRETLEGVRAGQASTRSRRAANAAMAGAGRFRQAAQDRTLDAQIQQAERAVVGVPGLRALRSDPTRAANAAVAPGKRTDRALRLQNGKVVSQPRVADDQIPIDATRERLDAGALRETLRAGEMVQRNSDGTYTHWNPATRAPTAAARRADVARRRQHRPPMFARAEATAASGRARSMYRAKAGTDVEQAIRDMQARRAYRTAAGGRINRPRRDLSPEEVQQRSFRRAMAPHRQPDAAAPYRRTAADAPTRLPRLLEENRERLAAERAERQRERRQQAISRTEGRSGRRPRADLRLGAAVAPLTPPASTGPTAPLTPPASTGPSTPPSPDPDLDWLPE